MANEKSTGGLEATHPYYDAFLPDWCTMRDLAAGERVVKDKRELYLPATPSMILDGFGRGGKTIGEQNYDAYIKRALFPDYVSEGIEILVGMLNHKAPDIKLPKAMEPLLKCATLSGESLEDLLRQIHAEQLTTGRLGLLADLPSVPEDAAGTAQSPSNAAEAVLPYITLYVAESIRNWDEAGSKDGLTALNMVVLDESGPRRDTEFTWKHVKQYRVLQLGDLIKNEAEGTATYKVGVFTDRNGGAALAYSKDAMIEPRYRGKTLEEIPFVFINTKDLVGTPDKAPLMGLGRLVLAIYRGEADYRQALFLTGQDTLVVIGGTRNPEAQPGEDGALRVGAGSRIDVDLGGDAKYVGVNSTGLSESRSSLENDHKRAAQKSGQLLPTGKANSQESGEALKTRLAAQTASLTHIAMSSAKGLEVVLKSIANWIGANEEEVVVTPNLEFGDMVLNTDDINGLMDARMKGAPISKRSIHALMKQRNFTSLEYDEELELVKEEDADMPRVAAGAGMLTAEEQLAQKDADRKAKQQQGSTEEDEE